MIPEIIIVFCIGLYDALDKLQRSYSRFNDDAYCARYRRDAKLICAGDKTGRVTVFDTATKVVIPCIIINSFLKDEQFISVGRPPPDEAPHRSHSGHLLELQWDSHRIGKR